MFDKKESFDEEKKPSIDIGCRDIGPATALEEDNDFKIFKNTKDGVNFRTAGFASIFTAVFIVVIGVTTRSRPAAAPPTGDFELSFYAIAYPTFAAGITASTNIFVSFAGTSAFLPVIAEMKKPQDFRKALYSCMGFVTISYMTFSLSAGQTIKMVSYGIGLVGLIVSACLYDHVAAKYLFVRILRNSRHLQSNTVTHWVTWLGCTLGLAAVSFILAEAIPIFSYLLALTGSICFSPLAMMLPGWLWLYDHSEWRKGSLSQMAVYWLHWSLILLGAFFFVGGTYGVVELINQAYADGLIGERP
ncbi:hypothetical protein LTR28_000968 [Elasticomyces elasticus]|nr:hypothetical protein LTR28_000968 [Elasticomyces elasticus]